MGMLYRITQASQPAYPFHIMIDCNLNHWQSESDIWCENIVVTEHDL